MHSDILCPGASLESKLDAAAKVIFQVLREQPESAPLVVALCGGRSVVGLLKAFLSESETQPSNLLQRVQFFMVDERIVPLGDPDSNFGCLKQQLFDTLIERGTISDDQLHAISATAENAQQDCDDYMAKLERFGGAFTVVVLGMGEDGHVAGLFPNHAALKLAGNQFIPFFDSPKPPSHRVTASHDLVAGASLGVLLALGEAKREAWNAFLSSDVSLEECPAKMVQGMRRCVVVTDLSDG